jgi:ligand-binding sensor domain-containing protein
MERAHKRKIVALAIFALGMLLAWGRGAYALDPALDVSQYAHTSWKIRDGFTKGIIFAFAQTPDGYLWLGTEFGLLRFDGVRAMPWRPPVGQQLPGDRINSLLLARDGTLWIGTLKGLASWKDGKLTRYPELDGTAVDAFAEGREGGIWVGVGLPGRLCAIQGTKIQCYGEGSFGAGVWGLYEDRNGKLWVSAATGLWRWDSVRPEHYTFPGEVNDVIEGESGELLLATSNGLKELVGGRIQGHALPGVSGQFRPASFFRSSDGSLWIAAHQGLLHVHQGRTDTFGAADGLSGDTAARIFEDREENIWVSTMNGLDRFREYVIPTISRNQGLSTSNTQAVQATTDGAVWISTPNGVNQWQNGRVTVYGRQVATGQVARGVARGSDGGLASRPRSLGLDDRGRLWAATRDGTFYFEAGRFIPVRGAPGDNIWSITSDGHGKMWVNNGTVGLFYFMPGEAAKPIPWTRFGQKGFGAQAVMPIDPTAACGLDFGKEELFILGMARYARPTRLRTGWAVAE